MIRKMRLLAVLLAFQGTAAVSDQAFALDQLKVAIGGCGMGETGITERAQAHGTLRKHGLDVEVFCTAGTGETQQAIISGSADIGVAVGILGALGAYSKGAPIRIVGASYTGVDQYWYVPGDSQIRTPQDTAGKTVAFSTNGSPTQSAVLQLRKHYNIPFVPTAGGTAQAVYTQVMSRQLDVGWAGAPFLVEQLEAGQIRIVMRGADVPALNRQTSRIIIANASVLARKADLVRRYLAAYREEAEWLTTSPDAVADYANYAKISIPAARRSIHDFLTSEQINPGKIVDIEGSMATAVEFKYLAAPLTAQQLNELVQIPSQ